ncbi:MAG: phage major tail tube protein [Sphingopyxis macrogoltabida]|uniref:Phage major tail tube protein n=1 Tax=Sphingopyxis macrogoltabida TaxID=33050 RepID=A0A2W5KVV4_SPHMC|nr:MAG: phage major tail tube protein [Sphingopyxis macrogoltabida]
MGAASDVRKSFNLFFNGKGHAGKVEDFTPPKLALVTEDFRGGGMDAAVELTMGLEKLECSFTLKSYDKAILSAFGLVEGAQVPLTAREALESYDGTVTPVVHGMRGKIKEIDQGTAKPGEAPPLKVSMALDYYKLQHGGTTVHEIDVPNMVRVVNGVDAMAPIRKALGL